MPGTYDAQRRTNSALGAREIKASPNYDVVTNGITLKGAAWAAGATVLEGQCIVKETASGKYVPYNTGGVVDNAGALPAGYTDPLILDQSITFVAKDGGGNPDVVCGQALIEGAVYRGMLIGRTAGFESAMKRVQFLDA